MTIWEYLSTRDPLLLIITGIMVLFFIYKGVVIIPWIKIPSDKKKQKRHQDCPLYHDYQAMRHVSREAALAPYRLVRDQMTMAEDAEEEVQDIIYKHFIDLLQEKFKDEPSLRVIDHPETRDYNLVTKYAFSRVKQKMRFFFQENHLAEMNDAQFREKKRERTSQILALFTKELNENFPATMTITREETYVHNKEIIPKIEKIVDEVFEKAKELAVKSRKELLAMEKGIIDKEERLNSVDNQYI